MIVPVSTRHADGENKPAAMTAVAMTHTLHPPQLYLMHLETQGFGRTDIHASRLALIITVGANVPSRLDVGIGQPMSW